MATQIDWGPSEWCDCLRGRLRTNTFKGYRGRLNHRVRLSTTKMAIIATGISWRPSDTCDGYRGRLRTYKLAVIVTGIG